MRNLPSVLARRAHRTGCAAGTWLGNSSVFGSGLPSGFPASRGPWLVVVCKGKRLFPAACLTTAKKKEVTNVAGEPAGVELRGLPAQDGTEARLAQRLAPRPVGPPCGPNPGRAPP